MIKALNIYFSIGKYISWSLRSKNLIGLEYTVPL